MVGIPSFSGGSLGIGKTISGGTDTRLLFNDGGLLADNTALTFNKTTGALSITNGTGTGLSVQGGIVAAYTSFGVSGISGIVNCLGVVVGSLSQIGFASEQFGTTFDTILTRDAANTLSQRNGTNAQEARLYATYAGATDYHRITTKFAKTTLSGVTGATVTATNLIPAGAILKGLSTKVTTGLGVSGGTSGYQVGDGTDPDRWGAITGTAAGTSSDNRNWTAGGERFFAVATSVVLTAVGGNFDGTGVIDVIAAYDTGECD